MPTEENGDSPRKQKAVREALRPLEPGIPVMRHPLSEADYRMAMYDLERTRQLLETGQFGRAKVHAGCVAGLCGLLERQEAPPATPPAS